MELRKQNPDLIESPLCDLIINFSIVSSLMDPGSGEIRGSPAFHIAFTVNFKDFLQIKRSIGSGEPPGICAGFFSSNTQPIHRNR
jgi:hypothetical protein